jgi:hypothetical protein
VPTPGRWQVVLTFAEVQTAAVPGWAMFPSYRLDGAPLSQGQQIEMRDELRRLVGHWPADIVATSAAVGSTAPGQVAVHVVDAAPAWCWRCSGVARVGSAASATAHVFVFSTNALNRPDLLACIAAHELGHAFGFEHTHDGSLMDGSAPSCHATASYVIDPPMASDPPTFSRLPATPSAPPPASV